MNVIELLAELRGRGVRLQANGDKLHVSAPNGVVTPQLRASLVEHKTELLAILAVAPLCHDCHGRPIAAGSDYFCHECITIMEDAGDPATHECPSCGKAARRLGRYLSKDGHSRYHCGLDGCAVIWRRPEGEVSS